MRLVLLGLVLACGAAAATGAPQRLIIDTDMGFDGDDVGAVCLGNALADAGLVELVAVVHNTGCKLGIGGVSAINHFYGRDDVPLGAWKGRFGDDCDKHYEGTSGQNQYLSTIIGNMVCKRERVGGPLL